MSEAPRYSSQKPVVVLGAGIIGLTTAIRILESTAPKPSVHIIAEHFPSDPPVAAYASLMAGAHHLSFADDNDTRQRRWDQKTFEVMSAELEKDGDVSGLLKIKQTEYYVGVTKHLQIYEEHPDFCVNDPSTLSLPFHVDHSVSFASLTMTPTIYLTRLAARFLALGGKLHRMKLASLDDLSNVESVESPPAVIVVCTGIGSLTLGGVADGDVHPVRGQIIKVHAPWVKEGFTRQLGSLEGGEGGERTYVIPRINGEVILGGTRETGDWEALPRDATGGDILRRATEICPALERCHSLSLTHLVGFRPARTGGVRLERSRHRLFASRTSVVYNYGHGGAGWQSCWGCAEDAAALVMGILQNEY